jgi:hypothetical protein
LRELPDVPGEGFLSVVVVIGGLAAQRRRSPFGISILAAPAGGKAAATMRELARHSSVAVTEGAPGAMALANADGLIAGR